MLRWITVIFVTLVALATAGTVAFVKKGHKAQPPVPRPGSFYDIPVPLPHGAPGTLLQRQGLTGLPAGMKGWRILYITDGYGRHRTVASGLVIVTVGLPAHKRHVVAIAHGTTGVAPRCGPSVLGGAVAPLIPGLRRYIRAGDVVVMADYQGLGTRGPHPYLIPDAEARSVIDSVRATRGLPEAHAGQRYAVVGESQGGQAALAVAQIAPRYGRGLELVGVAAAAPPTRLAPLFANAAGTPVGNILTAFTLSSWAQIYHEARLEQVVARVARPVVRSIDDYCVGNEKQLRSVIPHTLALKVRFLHTKPTKSKVWAKLLRRNSLHPFVTKTPILITQGGNDQLVLPSVTASYIKSMCNKSDIVEYRLYPGLGHLTIGTASANFSAGWIGGRLVQRAAPNSCPSTEPVLDG